jgi:gliding motility-associated-like protein
VQVSPLPSYSDAGEDVSTYFDHLFLNANTPKNGRGEWILMEGSGKIKDSSNPRTEVTDLGVGKNIFQWSISNAPCQDFKDEVVIELLELKIPTTITPNNDGLNDLFEITGIEFYPDNVVTIFNRWGTIIFSKSGYKNDWNGRSQDGKELSEDTYFCTVEINGKVVHKKYLIIKR